MYCVFPSTVRKMRSYCLLCTPEVVDILDVAVELLSYLQKQKIDGEISRRVSASHNNTTVCNSNRNI